ncbi:YciI family protein [Amycolatopsis nigrescens]|uniref:YciI family protein n=1 Tax=Amycolatopsis nigrescens TaxID=381445 RepID=UPI0003A588EB|nr:YciI family protein [Amycolatopsis nigrescens]
MKYVLAMYMNPAVWEALTEEKRNEVMTGHGDFMAKIKASGEFVNTQALSGPGETAVVRVSGGVPAVTDGPFLEFKEFLAGFYMVDVADRERAYELAAMIPDASVEGLGIEVRQVIFSDDAS